jgi:hypothetical protein
MSTSESCQENRTKDNATFMKAVNCYQLTPEKTQNEVIHQDHVLLLIYELIFIHSALFLACSLVL